jgi:hypothetical protein
MAIAVPCESYKDGYRAEVCPCFKCDDDEKAMRQIPRGSGESLVEYQFSLMVIPPIGHLIFRCCILPKLLLGEVGSVGTVCV